MEYVLEGGVRKAGNKIRITAQLIDVKSGFHVWAERYDRLIQDIFDLQDDISQSIVAALKISLDDSEKESLGKRPTDDLRAYDLYMRGKEFLSRRGKKNNEAAIRMFEDALTIDPRFAAVYAALAEAYYYMYTWYDGNQSWLGKTIEASQKAIGFDPHSVGAQFAIGTVYFCQKRYGDARTTWERVVQQRPEYYDAYRWLGIVADVLGEYDTALLHYKRCTEIKPYSEEPWMHCAMTFSRKGDKERSIESHKKELELCERKLAVNPNDSVTLSRAAAAYAQGYEKEKALAAINRVLEFDPNDGLSQYNCACTYAVLGNKDGAITCLTNAINSGYKNVVEWVSNDPDFASIHDDPEFKAVIAGMG